MKASSAVLPAGDGIKTENANWSFRGPVAENFDVHAKNSIPFYEEGQNLVTEYSDFFLRDGSTCYDLGTSQGGVIRKIASRHASNKSLRLIGIDSEADMLEVASRKAKDEQLRVEFVHGDARDIEFESADLIVCYYFCQFVPPCSRQQLFNKIFSALNWGGALILFEKVRGPDARFQDYATQIYNEFKIEKGYSAEEIINKGKSLKSVLEPFSTQGNLDLLSRAGFVDVTTIFKWLSFEGFLAIK